ncbi:unnamed protein product [marine sediment metagenome]|uniref:Uncharacterized protein n=1 Tax=marine sediment metagenome TaxID=412755 RepID=X0WRU0_9ZZZZ
MDGVKSLIASGHVKMINSMVFLTKSGKRDATLTYTGRRKWLKKVNVNGQIAKAKGSHLRNRKK